MRCACCVDVVNKVKSTVSTPHAGDGSAAAAPPTSSFPSNYVQNTSVRFFGALQRVGSYVFPPFSMSKAAEPTEQPPVKRAKTSAAAVRLLLSSIVGGRLRTGSFNNFLCVCVRVQGEAEEEACATPSGSRWSSLSIPRVLSLRADDKPATPSLYTLFTTPAIIPMPTVQGRIVMVE